MNRSVLQPRYARLERETPFLSRELLSREDDPLLSPEVILEDSGPDDDLEFVTAPETLEEAAFEETSFEETSLAETPLAETPLAETPVEPEALADEESGSPCGCHQHDYAPLEADEDLRSVGEVDLRYEARPFDVPADVATREWLQEDETPAPPPKLQLVEHWITPKTPDPGKPGSFTSAAVAKMTTDVMNPGFINASDELVVDKTPTGLQTCLSAVVQSVAGDLLSKSGGGKPSAADRVRVALVDLTGSKLTQPEFAGWGSPVAMYGASVPKILGLYAAYQLRADLRRMADTAGLTAGADVEKEARALWKKLGLKGLPDLVWLFDIRTWKKSDGPLDFSETARAAFDQIMHNCPAGRIIAKVGFEYIASVTWQSGLFHPSRGGLWLSYAYCGMGSWASPVSAGYVHNVTALSAATFFALLGQSRLVDDQSSLEMKIILGGGCFTGWLSNVRIPMVSMKCGIWNGYFHDCILAEDGSVRYAAAVLSRLGTRREGEIYAKLWTALDQAVRNNNKTPKTPC